MVIFWGSRWTQILGGCYSIQYRELLYVFQNVIWDLRAHLPLLPPASWGHLWTNYPHPSSVSGCALGGTKTMTGVECIPTSDLFLVLAVGASLFPTLQLSHHQHPQTRDSMITVKVSWGLSMYNHYCPHFTSKDTVDPIHSITCPRPHSQGVTEPGWIEAIHLPSIGSCPPCLQGPH